MAEGNDLHDRFLRKNNSLSRAYEISRKDKVKEKVAGGERVPVLATCHRCKQEKLTLKFHITETGRSEGAVSVSNEYVPLCEDCAPKKKKVENELSKKQINSLLRGAMKGRL
jgi:hypothetical protein